MNIEAKQVTEYHITVEAMPGTVFKVRAESVEKAWRSSRRRSARPSRNCKNRKAKQTKTTTA
jgi:hypothetical protein